MGSEKCSPGGHREQESLSRPQCEGPSSDHVSSFQGGRPFLRGLALGRLSQQAKGSKREGGRDKTKRKSGTVPHSGSQESYC